MTTPKVNPSIAWKYFTILKDDFAKVQCGICGTILSRGGKVPKRFSTSNMINHVKSRHPIEWSENDKSDKMNKLINEINPMIDEECNQSWEQMNGRSRGDPSVDLSKLKMNKNMNLMFLTDCFKERGSKLFTGDSSFHSQDELQKTVNPEQHSELGGNSQLDFKNDQNHTNAVVDTQTNGHSVNHQSTPPFMFKINQSLKRIGESASESSTNKRTKESTSESSANKRTRENTSESSANTEQSCKKKRQRNTPGEDWKGISHEIHYEMLKELLAAKQMELDRATEHPIRTFFRSMASTVMNFPPQLIAETRVKICNIVTEMELKALSGKTETTIPSSSHSESSYALDGCPPQFQNPKSHSETFCPNPEVEQQFPFGIVPKIEIEEFTDESIT